jgi:hypothetical protein
VLGVDVNPLLSIAALTGPRPADAAAPGPRICTIFANPELLAAVSGVQTAVR